VRDKLIRKLRGRVTRGAILSISIPAALFLGFLGLYLAFQTTDIHGDGVYYAIQIEDPSRFPHPHRDYLLYMPAWEKWWHFLQFLGYTGRAYWALGWLNAVMGGLAVAGFAAVLQLRALPSQVVLIASIGLGAAGGWFYHSTVPDNLIFAMVPLMAALWCAIRAMDAPRLSLWPVAAGGLAALAMATRLDMGYVVPSLALLTLQAQDRRIYLWRPLLFVVPLIGGLQAFGLLTYLPDKVLAYNQTTTVWNYISWEKAFLNAQGFVQALTSGRFFNVMSAFWNYIERPSGMLGEAIAILLIASVAFWVWRLRQKLWLHYGLLVPALVVWLIITAILNLRIGGFNFQQWVPSLIAFWALVALMLALLPPAWRSAAAIFVAAIFVLTMTGVAESNVARNRGGIRYVEELVTVTAPNDLLVAHGWTNISVKYEYVTGRVNFFRLTTIVNHDEAPRETLDAICETVAQGGRVYAESLFDYTQQRWDETLYQGLFDHVLPYAWFQALPHRTAFTVQGMTFYEILPEACADRT